MMRNPGRMQLKEGKSWCCIDCVDQRVNDELGKLLAS